MTEALTQRAVRVFAVLEGYRAGSPDILEALLPFFEPILVEFNGQILNQVTFAERVRDSYRWNFTSDIVEEFIPRFESKGWVEEATSAGNEAAYRVTYANPQATPDPAELHIGQVLLNVVQLFREFIGTISPLTGFSRSTNEFADMLVEWLVSIDAYTEDVLRQKSIQIEDTAGQLGIYVNLRDSSNLTSEERYLCARFVKFLFSEKSPFIPDLCKLASVGLLTEVIQDFQKPVTKVNRTNLFLYLDAPVALDLLGVSGKAAAANIKPIIAKLQNIGATVRIFRTSVNELQRALDAILRRSPSDRTGATADALRRNEVLEGFVRQVATDPERALLQYDVRIVDRTLKQFPNEHSYFTLANYEELFSQMRWHLEIPPREHDCTVIAHVMRMRRGAKSRDLFQTQHLLITRNGILAQLAKKFCVDYELMPKNSVGPVIHQRQLATAIWLRTGLGTTDEQEVPRRYLLAACERVLELKKNVVDQVKITARNLTHEKAEQLELLLSQDRSVQILMDKTLGVSNVVSSSNIEGLIDVMKRGLTEDIEHAAAEKLAISQRDATAKVRKAQDARRAAETQAQELHHSVNALNAEDQDIIERLLVELNTKIGTRRIIQKLSIALIIVFIGALPLLSETLSGYLKIVAILASGTLAAIFAFFQILDRPMGLERWIETSGRKLLAKVATERGLDAKLQRIEIAYTKPNFYISKNRDTEKLDL